MNTTDIIHTAIAADAIAQYQAEIEQLRQHPVTKRRDSLIAMREELIEQMTGVIELGAGMAEVECEQAAEQVETSAALDEAIATAQATGCAQVHGASSLVTTRIRGARRYDAAA